MTANDTGFDAIVLAIGGLVAGGIVLEGGGAEAKVVGFRPGIAAPLLTGFGDRVLDRASSLHGLDLAALGAGALERVGILVDGPAARGTTGLLVAGDCAADQPRTALGAAVSGIAAARRALAPGSKGP